MIEKIQVQVEMGRVQIRDNSKIMCPNGLDYPRYISGYRKVAAYRAQVPGVGLIIVEQHGPIRGLLIHNREEAKKVNQHFTPNGKIATIPIELASKRTQREFGVAFAAVGGVAVLANKQAGRHVVDTTPLPRADWPELADEPDDEKLTIWLAYWPR